MDEIPLKQMILPLIVLDDTPLSRQGPEPRLSRIADLKAWEKKHGRVPRGSFVALRTDMSKDWDKDPERFKRAPFPAWAFETIKFLYEQRGVTATGHEAMDTDTTDKMESETWLPAARALSDRGDGEPRSGAAEGRAHRGDLAEGEEGLGLPGAGVCDPAVIRRQSYGRRRHDGAALLAGAEFLRVVEIAVGLRHRIGAVVVDDVGLLVQEVVAALSRTRRTGRCLLSRGAAR